MITGYGHNTSGSQSMDSSQMQLGGSNRGGSLGRSSVGGRGSLPSVGKPSSTTFASFAGFLSSDNSKGETIGRERETSFTFIKERQREEKENSRKHEDSKKFDERREELRERERERERRRDEKEFRREKERRGDGSEDVREKEQVFQRVRVRVFYFLPKHIPSTF